MNRGCNFILCGFLIGSALSATAQPSSRGIDSFQIVHAHGRFWIASLLFDHERPGAKLPSKYLKNAGL